MKTIELLATGIRLLGIYVFIYALRTGISQYQYVMEFRSTTSDDMSLLIYLAIAQVLVLLIASLIMFNFPVSLSRWLIPKTHDNEPLLEGSAKDIESSIFVIIGVYTLSWAIPDLFNNIIWWWYSGHSQISGMWGKGTENEYMISLIVTVLEITIGLYLCLRSQGLSILLRKFRESGA